MKQILSWSDDSSNQIELEQHPNGDAHVHIQTFEETRTRQFPTLQEGMDFYCAMQPLLEQGAIS